ncbi:hypothetical protein [Bacillus sp. Brlt_9]|uniref:hypothetical protein n=1 Tax=Bacillus sp. Brlt_9 TaxID=3110916 RepID=UPI003F7BB099
MKKTTLTIEEILNLNYKENEFFVKFYELHMFRELAALQKTVWGGGETIKNLSIRTYDEHCVELFVFAYKGKPFAMSQYKREKEDDVYNYSYCFRNETIFNNAVYKEVLTDFMTQSAKTLTTNLYVGQADKSGTVELAITDEFSEKVNEKELKRAEQIKEDEKYLYRLQDIQDPEDSKVVTLSQAKERLHNMWTELEADDPHSIAIDNATYEELEDMCKGVDYLLSRRNIMDETQDESHKEFELYTAVIKKEDSITFVESSYFSDDFKELLEGTVRTYDANTHISHKEFTKVDEKTEGIWFVSQISDEEHYGFEFGTAGELKAALPKILEHADVDENNNPEPFVVIYPPDAKLVDIHKWLSN